MSRAHGRVAAAGRVVFTEGMGDTARLGPGEILAFHRHVWCVETWRLLDGGPVEMHLIHADGRHETRLLTLDPREGGRRSIAIEEAGSLRAARLLAASRPASVLRIRAGVCRPGCLEFPGAREILRWHPLHRSIVLEMASR
jgi:predicted cupin superfamily sugar epimerase